MAKKTIDITIDGNTGKITIHVDGYEHEACVELGRKLAGENSLIPSKGDISEPTRVQKKKAKKQKESLKEGLRNE